MVKINQNVFEENADNWNFHNQPFELTTAIGNCRQYTLVPINF